mgnify:CR=1 FL=1
MMPNIKISLLAVSLLVTSCGSTSYQEPSGEYRWVENPNMTVKDFNSSNLSCENQRLAITLPTCTMPYANSDNVWLRYQKDCDARNTASRDRNNVYKNCMQLSGYTLRWFEYWELEDLNSDESTQSIEVSADEDTASNRSLVSDQENADDESLTPSQAKSIDKLRQLYNRGMIKQSVFEYEVKLILESNN